MFIAFEGIDGAGKTTISQLVYQQISKVVSGSLYFPKSSLQGIGDYQFSHMTLLRNLIWPDDDGSEHYKLGDKYWLHLVAAWYSVIAREQVESYLNTREIAIFDSWYYRFVAKYTSRGYDRQRVFGVFEGLPDPDVTVWLDVDPKIAWERGHYKESEMGRWGEQFSPGQDSYLKYQGGVRSELAHMAETREWMTIRVERGLAVDTIVKMVVDEILRKC